ncbi:MAG: hypothetical protein ACJAT4_002647 [Granulosicoccus sp.]|jgi:hypothetical protein
MNIKNFTKQIHLQFKLKPTLCNFVFFFKYQFYSQDDFELNLVNLGVHVSATGFEPGE